MKNSVRFTLEHEAALFRNNNKEPDILRMITSILWTHSAFRRWVGPIFDEPTIRADSPIHPPSIPLPYFQHLDT